MDHDAINLIEFSAITDFLRLQAGADAQIAAWLDLALNKSLRKRPESAQRLQALSNDAPEWLRVKWAEGAVFHRFVPDADLVDTVSHVKDWLVAARRNEAAFLRNCDAGGWPKKLRNLDLASAKASADKYFERLNAARRHQADEGDATQTVMEFADGTRIVQLLTTAALAYEGAQMGHCIGGGAYDDRLAEGSCRYYSLRDAANRPHVTFEVEAKGNVLFQCKGKCNMPPVEKYMPQVRDFVLSQRLKLYEQAYHTGLVQDDRGRLHGLYALPEQLSVTGNLDFSGCRKLLKLPARLLVTGTLNLGGCTELRGLPVSLSVGGGLTLKGCKLLTKLPDRLWVNGDLDLTDCKRIIELPRSLVMRNGDIILHGCTAMTSFPADLPFAGTVKTDFGTFTMPSLASLYFSRQFGVPEKPRARLTPPPCRDTAPSDGPMEKESGALNRVYRSLRKAAHVFKLRQVAR